MQLQHIINGAKYQGTSKTTFNIYDPFAGTVLHTMVGASKEDTKKAIASAAKAQVDWEKISVSKKAQVMYKYRELILSNMDELILLICKERGKTYDDAKGEIARGLEVVEYCTGIVTHLKSEFSSEVSTGIDVYNIRKPVGVCAGITPFNFPAMVPMWMFPIAICCGNSFVLKLSEKVPSVGLFLTELVHQAGLPNGVLNTIVGDKEVVDELLTNPLVGAISFVGSTKVGEYIYHTAANHNKRVQALCGAKNHMVVMKDADIDQAVSAAMGAVYGSSGERCMAISVIVAVGDQVGDKLVELLKPKVEALKIGKYDEAGVELGPVIDMHSKKKILDYVEQGKKSGAELVVDGAAVSARDGFYVGGYLFDKVTTDMSIYTDEIFGPVMAIVRVENYQQALDLIKNHQYGNGAAIFTRDGDTARDFTLNVASGMVGINVPIPVPIGNYSFGGWKDSLFGASGIYGAEGIRFYTKLKTITSRWPTGAKDDNATSFAFPS